MVYFISSSSLKCNINEVLKIKFIVFLLFFLFHFNFFTIKFQLHASKEPTITNIINGIIHLAHPKTQLPLSHLGHPCYENVLFIYDLANVCLILNATQNKQKAEKMLNYLIARFRIKEEKINRLKNANGNLGLIKIYNSKINKKKLNKSIVNAIDRSSTRIEGSGHLNFEVTPDCLSHLIFAFLQINKKKYKKDAFQLGDVLIAMQNKKGGITDGTRSPQKVNTAHHISSYMAFNMLYEVSNDTKYKKAANNALNWFKNHVFFSNKGMIYQGCWKSNLIKNFETDAYSRSLAGPLSDNMSLAELEKLIHNMLAHSLVNIRLSLPNNSKKTLLLADFYDPQEKNTIKQRKKFHPVGSLEKTGIVILALQKCAVRFFKEKKLKKAKFYKAIAEILIKNVKKGFYFLPELKKGAISFYATAQRIKLRYNMKTPYYYVGQHHKKAKIKGGSIISSWFLLPLLGFNPYILNDRYIKEYQKIPYQKNETEKVKLYIKQLIKGRYYEESLPGHIKDFSDKSITFSSINKKIWENLNSGKIAIKNNKKQKGKKYFKKVIYWSKKIIHHPVWLSQAIKQNKLKAKQIGGLIGYPWGTIKENNNLLIHYDIWHYPVLNEVAVAMFGLVYAYTELDEYDKAKYWIKHIIHDIPYHQIADAKKDPKTGKKNLIQGYWNILSFFEKSLGANKTEQKIYILYNEVLDDLGIDSAEPETFEVIYDINKKAFD